MDKIIEALNKILPENQVKDISEAVKSMLEDARKELEAEFNTKLEEAYVEMSEELKTAETVGEQGYQEAYTVIQDLRNRLEVMKTEYEKNIEEGYEDAYQMIKEERRKAETVEAEIYKETEEKLAEIKSHMVNLVHDFLKFKGKEIYEMATRDILNDPRMVEHKVALDSIVNTVSKYVSDEDFAVASNAKLEDANKTIEDLKGRMQMVESRNIKLSTDNTKLMEQVRSATQLINESTKTTETHKKNARVEAAKNAQGRGKVLLEGEEVLPEPKGDEKKVEKTESTNEHHTWGVLSGLKTNN